MDSMQRGMEQDRLRYVNRRRAALKDQVASYRIPIRAKENGALGHG